MAPELDRIRVLIVDDDEDDYLLTSSLFDKLDRNRHELSWAPDRLSALRAADERDYDIWLVDYRLGADDGIELVRELVTGGRDMPLIVLTGQGDRRVDIEAAEAGAADYLVKGEISPALLERTIRYAIQRRLHLRTIRENEERLRQTQRMESLGRLAGGIAHDFNNMMSVVIGLSELGLRHVDDPERLANYLDQIKGAGQRAARMTQQLLAFSRKQVLDPRVLDLNAVVTGMHQLLQHVITDEVEMVALLDPALEPVRADPGQLEQVLMNLAINASDAMPSGGTLTIETSNIDIDALSASQYGELEPGPYVCLAMSDTGIGMDAALTERIFEPFFTTKEVGKGTGLGLATVFGIVRQSGGDIRVYSELGIGTTFSIYLPRVGQPVDALAPAGGDAEPSGGDEVILVVEDEDLVRTFECEVLTGSGYAVLEARSAVHALELARDHPGTIDLLLTDVVMPGMNGKALAERVAETRPEILTLYTSGYTADGIVRHGMLEPGVSFLPKPLTHPALLRKVRDLLDGATR